MASWVSNNVVPDRLMRRSPVAPVGFCSTMSVIDSTWPAGTVNEVSPVAERIDDERETEVDRLPER